VCPNCCKRANAEKVPGSAEIFSSSKYVYQTRTQATQQLIGRDLVI
jgi:hypothetical protein